MKSLNIKKLATIGLIALSAAQLNGAIIISQTFEGLTPAELLDTPSQDGAWNTSADGLDAFNTRTGIFIEEAASTLGFTTTLVATRGAGDDTFSDNSDNDIIGIVNDGDGWGGPTAVEGSQKWIFSDLDSELTMLSTEVNLSLYTGLGFSLQYFVTDTSYEPEDKFVISLTDGTNIIELLNPAGIDTLDEDSWVTLTTTDFTGLDLTQVRLSILVDNNDGAEDIYIDDIFFEGILIPEPSSALLVLIGLGSLAFIRWIGNLFLR